MLTQAKLVTALAILLSAIPASAGTLAYVVTGNPDGSGGFGVIDLNTGAFRQIGPGIGGSQGLVSGPNGSLFTLAFTGTLNSINPATGVATSIGPTGLVDCSTPPASPCGPKSSNAFASVGGRLYATDFANNLYGVDATTGAASLIGLTGIPAVPFTPITVNPDGTFNAYDEALFGANGELYATFDAFTVDPNTFTTGSVVIPPKLYQIDPLTGVATLVGPTTLNLAAVAGINGSYYAFNDGASQVVTLDLATGRTNFVAGFDPSVGIVTGVVATPEPTSVALAALGFAGLFLYARRKQLQLLRQQWRRYTLALTFALGAAVSARADGPTFTSIDFPGAASTSAWGINTRGEIVGGYLAPDKSDHGFLLSGGQYRTIDFPSASATEAFTINPRGDVGGFYTMAGIRHGYLLSGGQFTTIDFPGAASSEVGSINARGDVLGDYTLAGLRHGYLLSGGQFSSIDVPGATNTLPVAFNPQGDIVGNFITAGVVHGFLLSEGDFTVIDFPSSTRTGANGINAKGDIAGRYVADGVSHAFLLSGGLFNTIDYPGATFTSLDSMNQRGDLLGRYTKDGLNHGYVLAGFRPGCVNPLASPKIAVVAGGAAVTHSSDFTIVTASKPAAAGEVLAIFATGLGPTRPSVAAGQPFPANPLVAVDSLVEVRVNGRSAIVLGSVGLPGAIAGYQVNFRMPADTAQGLAAIEVSAAGVAGPPVNIMVE